jgi:cytochrome c553
MAQEQRPSEPVNPWPRIAWWSTAGMLALGVILGFVVLGREQQNGSPLGAWTAFCRALGVSADAGPAGEPQPPLVTPTRIAWTGATLGTIAGGNAARGAFVAEYCTACHGDGGVSRNGLYPTLAGMQAEVIYKQLDDFRTGKRQSGVMNAIAEALSLPASADVAAHFASRTNGLVSQRGEPFESGHTLREQNPAIRLVFAGDPARGIPPCAACHGPASTIIGAPFLHGQQPAYIERQLAAFAQGWRQNDINEQMRTVAAQLTPDDMRAVAEFYGAGAGPASRIAGR